MFNTGQITLPKKWRNKFKTQKFIAEETAEGLLIKPLEKDEAVYYESKDSFGIYCESGLDIKKMIAAIDQINISEKDGKVSKISKKTTTGSKKVNS